MAIVYQKSKALTDKELHYCPGCSHGIIHKLVAEVLEELGFIDAAIGICPVGCSVFAYDYFACDMLEAAHGRAPAVATGRQAGASRSRPSLPIRGRRPCLDRHGRNLHAAIRGEKITTIFVNNAIYGMTGGQMAPTTLIGQKTTTSPLGRDPSHCGGPAHMAELLAAVEGAAYVERVAVYDIPRLNQAKRAIKTAFEMQMQGAGFTFVEVLSSCPTNWGKTPLEAAEWVREQMVPVFPLGVTRDIRKEAAK